MRRLHDDRAHDQRRRVDQRRDQLAARAIDVAIVLGVLALALSLCRFPRARCAIDFAVLPQDKNLSTVRRRG
jgi:hypothetical protein